MKLPWNPFTDLEYQLTHSLHQLGGNIKQVRGREGGTDGEEGERERGKGRSRNSTSGLSDRLVKIIPRSFSWSLT